MLVAVLFGFYCTDDDKSLPLCPCAVIVGEKRKPTEPLPHEENKRPRAVGDIPLELINEVMATITDPAAIPEVKAQNIKGNDTKRYLDD